MGLTQSLVGFPTITRSCRQCCIPVTNMVRIGSHARSQWRKTWLSPTGLVSEKTKGPNYANTRTATANTRRPKLTVVVGTRHMCRIKCASAGFQSDGGFFFHNALLHWALFAGKVRNRKLPAPISSRTATAHSGWLKLSMTAGTNYMSCAASGCRTYALDRRTTHSALLDHIRL
jgi:hypothetical protein